MHWYTPPPKISYPTPVLPENPFCLYFIWKREALKRGGMHWYTPPPKTIASPNHHGPSCMRFPLKKKQWAVKTAPKTQKVDVTCIGPIIYIVAERTAVAKVATLRIGAWETKKRDGIRRYTPLKKSQTPLPILPAKTPILNPLHTKGIIIS